MRRRLPLLILSGCLLALLALPGPILAAEVRNDTVVTVPAGQTVEDDLIAAGQTVAVAGRVTGDVYAMGQTVVVSGTIDGDLIAAAEEVTVEGTVLGDVRAAGARVTLNGQAGKNVTAAGQRVLVGQNGRVGGSVLAAAETLSAFGPISRGATFAAGTAQLAGPVGGNVRARVGSLSIQPTARIAGGLDYHARQEAGIPPGTVSGPLTFTQVEPEQERPQRPDPFNGLFDLGSLIWLVGSALLGVVGLLLFPPAAEQLVQLGSQRPLQSFGLGLAVLFLTPLAGLLIALTLIGLPVSLTLALAYGLGLLLAWPAIGLLVGSLLARATRRAEPLPAVLALLVGLIALHLATHIPFLGGLIGFLSLVLGIGLVLQLALRWHRPTEPAPLAAAIG